MPHYVKKLWEKNLLTAYLFVFFKEFAVAVGRSGMSCEAYVFFVKALGKLFG
jgi:hypothetical protein